jgi:hypothetical protein
MLQIFHAVTPKEKASALPSFGNKPIIGRIKILK